MRPIGDRMEELAACWATVAPSGRSGRLSNSGGDDEWRGKQPSERDLLSPLPPN